jgi:hypothetical protein
VFPKLKFKPKIKIKSPIELQHHKKENEGLPLRIHIYFTLKPAHISFKALILPNCIVIITKIIRSLDALSISPFLVIDDNTIWLKERDVYIQQFSEELPLDVCIVKEERPQMPLHTHLQELPLNLCINTLCTSVKRIIP